MMRGLGYLRDIEDGRDKLLASPRSLPPAATLRPHVRTVLDQGLTNSCVAHAIAMALDIEQRARGLDVELLSIHWLYWWAREVGNIVGDSGSRIRDAVRALRDMGCPTERELQFMASQVNKRPSWRLHRAAHDFRGVKQYRRALSPNDFRHSIANGAPVVAGWDVDRDFLDPRGPRDILSLSGEFVGGHALCIFGYSGEWFEGVNSWGNWRDAGFFRFHESVIEQARDAWVIDTNA